MSLCQEFTLKTVHKEENRDQIRRNTKQIMMRCKVKKWNNEKNSTNHNNKNNTIAKWSDQPENYLNQYKSNQKAVWWKRKRLFQLTWTSGKTETTVR